MTGVMNNICRLHGAVNIRNEIRLQLGEVTINNSLLYVKEQVELAKNPKSAIDEEDASDPEKRPVKLLCQHCLFEITSGDQGISRRGKHRHLQCNPNGNVFDFRCFSQANCLPVGPESNEFSWFPGYSWQIALCGKCLAHLGWLFNAGSGSETGDIFYGLINNRLVEEESRH